MKCLLLVAHGSRRAASNEEVRQLTALLRDKAGERYGFVSCAFLELATPSIPEGIEACVQAGADTVVVLPYFLSAGRHVSDDIPAEIALKTAEYPALTVTIAPYLGAAAAVPEVLLSLV